MKSNGWVVRGGRVEKIDLDTHYPITSRFFRTREHARRYARAMRQIKVVRREGNMEIVQLNQYGDHRLLINGLVKAHFYNRTSADVFFDWLQGRTS